MMVKDVNNCAYRVGTKCECKLVTEKGHVVDDSDASHWFCSNCKHFSTERLIEDKIFGNKLEVVAINYSQSSL